MQICEIAVVNLNKLFNKQSSIHLFKRPWRWCNVIANMSGVTIVFLRPITPFQTYIFVSALSPHNAGLILGLRPANETGLNNSIGPIARNCPKWPSGNRICRLKLPAKLVLWKFGQQTFSCVKQLLTAHPMRSGFWGAFCKVNVT